MVCADAVPARAKLAVIISAAMDRFISPPIGFLILSGGIMPGIISADQTRAI
jgi:hypothetical protein